MGASKTAPQAVAVVVRPASRPRLISPFLQVSPSVFRVCWLLIELSHLINAAFAMVAAAAHLLLAVPGIYENVSVLSVRRDMLLLAGWSYVVVGLIHVAVFTYNVLRSCRHCTLTFGYDPRAHLVAFAARAKKQPTRTLACPLNWTRKHSAKLVGFWLRYFSIDGLFGARGARFEDLFHARQLVEVILQIYQAYQLSRAIPRAWINHGVVIIMLMNGISAVVIESALKKGSLVQRRITLLVVDLLVDLAIAVVVPMLIIVPRILAFNFKTSRLPPELLFSDTWGTTAVTELRQILVTSEIDYISSLLPHVLWLSGLDTIKAMLIRKSSRIDEAGAVPNTTLYETQCVQYQPSKTERSWKSVTILGYLNGICIIGMLAVHSTAIARYHTHTPSTMADVCVLRVPAWMATRTPCSVVNVNCHRLNTTGSDETVSKVLAQFDQGSAARLIFSHCPGLHVPRIITEFSHLRAFTTFNSTITTWSSSAALTNTRQPMIGLMHFIHTNFSTPSFPDGIYHSDLPTGINLLVFHSNLSALPQDIDQVWASHLWVSFWIEKSKLSQLPPTFRHLNIRKLALLENEISLLDDDIFDTQKLSWIRLSQNPLVRLPSSLEKASVLDGLTHLLVENTVISNVSETFRTRFVAQHNRSKLFVASFQGSPLCDSSVNEDLCDVIDPVYKDAYPIDIVAAQRPV